MTGARTAPAGSGDTEQALVFDCEGAQLPGVLHRPAQASSKGVLVVVGGPQTRVGSHRQFVLLARDLAAAGYPVLRFDYRGMGDADDEFVGFEGIAQDIRAAVDTLQTQCPEVSEVVIWGLCDAATAAAFYAPSDARITGLVLLNPWVRTEQGEAEAYLKHYYVRRIIQKDFWYGLLRGEFNPFNSIGSLAGNLGRARSGASGNSTVALPQRMADALAAFRGGVLVILSGNDLTAREFSQATKRMSAKWESIFSRSGRSTICLDEANHTFSRKIWRSAVSKETVSWMES